MGKFDFIKNKGRLWGLLMIIVISVTVIIYFGDKKEGYHIDELYSYGLANSEYLPFMHFGVSGYDVKDWMMEYGAGESFRDLFSNLAKDFVILKDADFNFYNTEIYQAYCTAQANSADTYTSTWVPGQDYLDYLAVSEDNTFNYASVYYNQRGDVHPPFFYILLHTVCSVFQGSFSKWLGIGLNIVISVITLLVLYKMCVRHFHDDRLAFVVLSAFAFSSGFVSTALFIRMYALLTLMTLLCCYTHLEILRNNFIITRKLGICLFLSVLGGYYTQYYFVLYAIGIALVMTMLFIYNRKWKGAATYVAVLIAAAVAGIAIWPFSVKHVFSGYRGRESLQVLKEGDFFLYKADYMIDNIWNYMFGGNEWLFPVVVAVGVLLCIVLRGNEISYGKSALIAFPVVGYTLIVGQISPFLTDRYVMCTYPFLCVIFVGVAYSAAIALLEKVRNNENIENRRLQAVLMVLIGVIMVGMNNIVMHTPGYLASGGQETYDVPANTDCVYVLTNGTWNESAEDTNILAKCNRVGVVYESNLELLAEDYSKDPGEYLAVMVNYSLDADSVLQRVRESFHVEDMMEVRRDYGGNVLRILLQR